MTKILTAFKQSFESLLRLRMLLLVILPPFVAVVILFAIFFAYWVPWSTGLSEFLHGVGVISWLENWSGLHEIAPILAMAFLLLLFIPLSLLLAVLFTSIFVMPFALKWVVQEDFPNLEKKRGGSTIGSLWNALTATFIFIFVFFVTLPLWFIPGLQIVVPLLLTAWLNKKIFMYDVLQDFASKEERRAIENEEWRHLYGLGMLVGAMSYIPLAILILPVFAALAYTYFGLNELKRRRG